MIIMICRALKKTISLGKIPRSRHRRKLLAILTLKQHGRQPKTFFLFYFYFYLRARVCFTRICCALHVHAIIIIIIIIIICFRRTEQNDGGASILRIGVNPSDPTRIL
ncbi:hypothetical protein M426DRAFT_240087 [Hypoxylon sp. CI-4A]|nr:hypothetical protein M426DRAFT_240087 [Hypoxylon sp. CI-4A]